MKKIKRTLALLLAACMLLGLLAACDNAEKPSDSSDPDATGTPVVIGDEYPIEPEELGSGEVKWSEEKTADGWMKVTNEGGETLGYSPDSGVKLIQVGGLAFKDLNKNGKLDLYEDWRQEDNARAEDLSVQLTPEEISGLMVHPKYYNITEDASDITGLMDEGYRTILSAASSYPIDTQAKWNNAMQAYVEGIGAGIPVNISTDPRSNGIWPSNLGMAASFDPDMVLEIAKQIAAEYRSIGITTLLGPQIDLATEPRWRRVAETFGEDPALVRDMAKASIGGYQSTYDESGNDLGWGKDSVNTMIKHWPGEGAAEGGRESHDWYGAYQVYPGGQFETHLIPFVDAGFNLDSATGSASAIMPSYSIAWSEDGSLGELVGSAFSEYKIDLLHSYGFDGLICSDWGVTAGTDEDFYTCWGVEDLTVAERFYKAIVTTGVDQVGGDFPALTVAPIKEAYNTGVEELGEDVILERFQNSARRILKTFFQVGLFENPYVDVANAVALVGKNTSRELGYEAQLKSVVMLKNDGDTISAANASNEKPTVYIPMLYTAETNNWGYVAPSAYLPVSLDTANKYFNVVTDSLSAEMTGPADPEGNPTIAYEDIIRATPEELAECDFALIFMNSPDNYIGDRGSGGYDDKTESFIPNSLQYGPYTADSTSVRRESIGGPLVDAEITTVYGTQIVKQKENWSYYGNSAKVVNASDLDTIAYATNNLPEQAKVIVSINAETPVIVSEFENQVDAILVGFGTDKQAIMDIVTGQYEPSGLLPFQMPANMETVEAQYEDVPRDMECYVDAAGNTYDFGFGMNWSGVIQDERTAKYCVPALTAPETQPVG